MKPRLVSEAGGFGIWAIPLLNRLKDNLGLVRHLVSGLLVITGACVAYTIGASSSTKASDVIPLTSGVSNYLAHQMDPPPEVTVRQAPVRTYTPSSLTAPTRTRVIKMEVTAYCPCKICCGRRARGITASGRTIRANGGSFVAADTDVLPFNTRIIVPGYNNNQPIPVLDRGGDIVGHRLDVFFKRHADAEQWGRKILMVSVVR